MLETDGDFLGRKMECVGARISGGGKDGFLGIFKGGLTASSAGIAAALVFGYVGSLVFKPKMKG